MTYRDVKDVWRNYSLENPLKHAVWLPTSVTTCNIFLHRVSVFIFNMVPVAIIDMFNKITGKQPSRYVLYFKFKTSKGLILNVSFYSNDKYYILETTFWCARCLPPDIRLFMYCIFTQTRSLRTRKYCSLPTNVNHHTCTRILKVG